MSGTDTVSERIRRWRALPRPPFLPLPSFSPTLEPGARTICPSFALFLISVMSFFSCCSSLVRSRSSSRCAFCRLLWCCRSRSAGVLLRPKSDSTMFMTCRSEESLRGGQCEQVKGVGAASSSRASSPRTEPAPVRFRFRNPRNVRREAADVCWPLLRLRRHERALGCFAFERARGSQERRGG